MIGSRYQSEPGNLTVAQVDERIRAMLSSPSAYGSYVPRGVPQISVDIPIVTALPLGPENGTEVYLEVDATSHAVAHMLYLRAITGWVQTGAPPILTTLPATGPHEGFQVVYDTGTAGVRWSLVYDTSDGTTYPWLYVGGGTIRADNAGTSMVTASATYVDLSTVGPSITAPLDGDYAVQWWFQAQHAADSGLGYMAIKNGSAATADANSIRGQAGGAGYDILAPVGSQEITVAAGDVLKAQYRTPGGGNLTVNNAGTVNPWMTVRPVRVAGA